MGEGLSNKSFSTLLEFEGKMLIAEALSSSITVVSQICSISNQQ